MIRVYSNFIEPTLFLQGLSGHENFGLGDITITQKPITIFNDFVPQANQLLYNPYNISLILEPNQLFHLHDWAVENGHVFSTILTWSEQILQKCDNAYMFPFGISWLDKEYVKMMETKRKVFEVSYLCGAKKMIEGHFLRHMLYNRGNEIKIPKKWFYTLSDYSPADQRILGDLSKKKVVWDESMFSICIENSSNKNYHTEKIIDAFLSKTIPIYWGCPNLEELGYDSNGYFLCKDENEIIKVTNSLTENMYYDKIVAINYNYELAKHYADLFGRFNAVVRQIIEINNIQDDVYCSQELEDKWIDENLILPDKGTFLDIGACYPIYISNTYFFEHNKGWNGLAIEPDPIYFNELKKYRICNLEQVAISNKPGKAWYKPKNHIVEVKDTDSIEIECTRIDTLLNKHNITIKSLNSELNKFVGQMILWPESEHVLTGLHGLKKYFNELEKYRTEAKEVIDLYKKRKDKLIEVRSEDDEENLAIEAKDWSDEKLLAVIRQSAKDIADITRGAEFTERNDIIHDKVLELIQIPGLYSFVSKMSGDPESELAGRLGKALNSPDLMKGRKENI